MYTYISPHFWLFYMLKPLRERHDKEQRWHKAEDRGKEGDITVVRI